MSPPTKEVPSYLAPVVLKIAEATGLKLAYRQPLPLVVVPVVPGLTSKRGFVRAIVEQVAGAVKAPKHILSLPRGTGAGGLPLKTVMTSTADDVQIVWAMSASPPPGTGTGANSFQAVTGLAALSDAQFHDCVRRMQSREANSNRGQEDYFVMEVNYGHKEQHEKRREEKEEEGFLPLPPPRGMWTTRENFSHDKRKRLSIPPPLPALPQYPHSQQYEREQQNIRLLSSAASAGLMGPPPVRGGGGGGLLQSRTQCLPTLEEVPEEDVEQAGYAGEEEDPERTPRTSKLNKGKQIAARTPPPPLPKTPAGSPRRRHHQQSEYPAAASAAAAAAVAYDPKHKPLPQIQRSPERKPKWGDDGRPVTHTPEVWDINKTILDDRINAYEQQQQQQPHNVDDDDDGEAAVEQQQQQRRRSPSRATGSKSRIPVLPSFRMPHRLNFKKSASSPSLLGEYKKGEAPSSSSSSSQGQKDSRPSEN